MKSEAKKWREECGVFGIWNHEEASRLVYLGLYALQHRGQESAGIVSLDQGQHHSHKSLGLVAQCFHESDLDRLHGKTAIGHVRYSTTGESFFANAQPLSATLPQGSMSIGHNGNIINSEELRGRVTS